MVARSWAANRISSFRSYAARQKSTKPPSNTRTVGLQNQVRSITNNINSNRTNTTPSPNSGSYLDDIDYGGTSAKNNAVHSDQVQNIQNTIDSLRNLRQTLAGDKKVAVAQEIVALQKEMIKATAQKQGAGSDVGTRTLRARNNFINALQGVVDEAERYNQTGVYREDISTQLLEKLQDSMNADFFKLVGTEEGQALLNQVDQMGVNLSQENIDFINKHTGVVDILYGNYDIDLAIGETNKAKSGIGEQFDQAVRENNLERKSELRILHAYNQYKLNPESQNLETLLKKADLENQMDRAIQKNDVGKIRELKAKLAELS